MGWDSVGTVTTGILGLAGIVGAVWASGSDRKYHERRSLLDGKHHAYAHLFACIDRLVMAIHYVWRLRKARADAAALETAVVDMNKLKLELNSATYEAALIGPEDVIKVIVELRVLLGDRAWRAESACDEDYTSRHVRLRLLNAMRNDLGHRSIAAAAFRLEGDG